MQAGKLRESVTFSKRSDSDDGFGNLEAGWGSEFSVAARIAPLRGGEDVMASRLTGKQPVLVTVRRCRATLEVTPDWRLTDARTGTVYNIRTASPSEDKTVIDMICETGVAV
jgi:head-tail adaptor